MNALIRGQLLEFSLDKGTKKGAQRADWSMVSTIDGVKVEATEEGGRQGRLGAMGRRSYA